MGDDLDFRGQRIAAVRILTLMTVLILASCAAPVPPVSPAIAATGDISTSLDPLTPIGSEEVDYWKPTVKWLNPFSPAGAAGMRVGDVITEIGGRPAWNLDAALDAQREVARLGEVNVTVKRIAETKLLHLKKHAGDDILGFSLYPWDAVYVLKNYPGLPKAIHFLNMGGVTVTAYAASVRGLSNLVLVRFAIANAGSDVLEAPQGTGATAKSGQQLRQPTSTEVVNAAFPSLGALQPLMPPPREPPPVYFVPQGGTYAYPVQSWWTVLPKLVTDLGNIAIENRNRQISQREQDRQRMWLRLNARALRPAALPPNSQTAGDVFYSVPYSDRPFRALIKVGDKWFTFTFE